MSRLELYRELYEHEKESNHQMLAMLESVPEANRSDVRFKQALTLADHLAACRENWLIRMTGTDQSQAGWWDEQCEFATLRPRFAALESHWTVYLARLDEDRLMQNFEFTESGEDRFNLPVQVQVVQLFGHAAYHRGQIALLVDQLGGETVDTDYVDWWWANLKQKE